MKKILLCILLLTTIGLSAQHMPLDPTFNGRGYDTIIAVRTGTQAYSLSNLPNGKLLVGIHTGYPYLGVAQFTSDGKRDSTFGTNSLDTIGFPITYTTPQNILLQNDGRSVAVNTLQNSPTLNAVGMVRLKQMANAIAPLE